ncbi:hypothetical protein [Seonamhaeicola maritimus]|uniref:Uncharacterized protein n=1 Tax=Seonamhaeicola maritimus TaxID=2591822 RepID=A0A5C7GJ12_9FLAO|nr:hypothetical protein [Seonamhaeicola maritimus]TXG37399.1 hypothetical protein FUA22_12665 [Seonamhaeicola maritimus]
MKKLTLKLLSLTIAFSSLTLTNCSTEDPAPIVAGKTKVLENLDAGVLNGTLEENYSLSASTIYNLTGQFIIADGATLNIPAGTRILADNGGTDVYIAVLKGGEININGNAGNPVIMSSSDGNPGDWGGLTLCGKATTTAGVDAEAEVGGFLYGGNEDTDSSGIIRYLQIAGTGAQINPESQYNGISFYAVGSSTLVDNVAVINGSDDGVEFFGGTVSVSNLYLENNDDDSIDWTEGWNGSVTNAYISHTVSGFSTVFEGDKDNGNPTFTNITAISTVGGTALQFKKQSGGTITNLHLTGYAVDLDMKDGGDISNVQIEGATPDAALISGETSKYTLNSGKDAAAIDAGSFSWVDTDVNLSNNILAGNISGTTTLDASISYLLTSSLIVQDGGKLVIPAGTKITAKDAGTDVYIAVLKGGEIDIQGEAGNPVIIASINGNGGDWGGLTLCGKATTTAGIDAQAEVGGFIYGGTEDTDNSGSIKYLVLKGTGAQINSESQYNGLSLYAVGSSTTIENVSVINGSDDGIEFFGGTVSVSNLYLENNDDDSIDWTEGWSGGVSNAYISHTVAGFSTVFEGDKDNGNPSFSNITAISTVGGTALQFKKQSGGTITGLHLSGYTVDLDMKDGGALANVQIEGADANATLLPDETKKYTLNSGKDATALDISGWTWKDASL